MSAEIKAFLAEKRRSAVRAQKVQHTPMEASRHRRAATSPSPPPTDPNRRDTSRVLVPPAPTPAPIAARSTPTVTTQRSLAGRKHQQVVPQSSVPAFIQQPDESTTTPAGMVSSRFGSVAAVRHVEASLTTPSASSSSGQLLLSDSQIRVAKADAVWGSLRGIEEAVRFRETGVDLNNRADPFTAPIDDQGPLPVSCSELLSICTNMLVVATTYRDEEEHSKAEIVASHSELLTRWPFNSRRRHSYEDWLVFGVPPRDAHERAVVEGERVRLHHESLLIIALCSSNMSRWGDALGAMRECIAGYVHNQLHTQLAPSPDEEALSSMLSSYFPTLNTTTSTDVPVELLLNYISLLTLAIEGGHYVTGPAAPMHDGQHYILSDASVAGEVGVDAWGIDAARSDVLRTASMVAARCGSKLEVLRGKEAVSTLMSKGCIEARDAYTNYRALLASQLCAARIHIAEVLQDELQIQYNADNNDDNDDSTTSMGLNEVVNNGDLAHSKGLYTAVSTTLLLSSTQRLMLEELGAGYPLYNYLLGLISGWSHWLSNSPVTLGEVAVVGGESAKSQRWREQVASARKCVSSLFNKKASSMSYQSTTNTTTHVDAISLSSSIAPYRLGLLLLSQCKRGGVSQTPKRKASVVVTQVNSTGDRDDVVVTPPVAATTLFTAPEVSAPVEAAVRSTIVSPTYAPQHQDTLPSSRSLQPPTKMLLSAPSSPVNASLATSCRRSSAAVDASPNNSPRHRGGGGVLSSDGRPPWKGSGAVVRRQQTDLPEIESCTEVQSIGRRSRSASPTGVVNRAPSPTNVIPTLRRKRSDVPPKVSSSSSPPDTILVITSGSVVQPISVRPMGEGVKGQHPTTPSSSIVPSRRTTTPAPNNTTTNASSSYPNRHRWVPEDDDEDGYTTNTSPSHSYMGHQQPHHQYPQQQQQPPMQLHGSYPPPPHHRRQRSPGSTRSSIPLRDQSGPSPVANIYGFAESSVHMRRPMGDQLDTAGHHPLHVVDPPNGRGGSPDAPQRKASKGHIWPLN